jgi:hypothetical protein
MLVIPLAIHNPSPDPERSEKRKESDQKVDKQATNLGQTEVGWHSTELLLEIRSPYPAE